MASDDATIAGASAFYVRLAAAINGVLSAIGISVALWVYERGGLPQEIQHMGKYVWKEGVESYLFAFPLFQVVLFLVPTFYAFRWRNFARHAIQKEIEYKSRNPSHREMDVNRIYHVVCVLFVVLDAVFLAATVFRSISLAARF